MRISPYIKEHPVTGEATTIYMVPKPGPLFEFRFSGVEKGSWTTQCMPAQIYSEQGQHTVDFLRHTFADAKAIAELDLPAHADFANRLAAVRACAGGGNPGGFVSGSTDTSRKEPVVPW